MKAGGGIFVQSESVALVNGAKICLCVYLEYVLFFSNQVLHIYV